MLKKLIITLFLFAGYYIYPFNISLANLNVYRGETSVEITAEEETVTKSLLKSLKRVDYEGLLNIQPVLKNSFYEEKLTKSTVDASELSSLLNVDYLLYGFIEKTNKYYNAEIRLFENETKTDKKTFYVKTELGSFDDVLNELSNKIINYLYETLGISEYHKERKLGFGGIGIYTGAGYWFPISNWWNIMTGLVNFELGVNVIPITPIVRLRNFAFYNRIGFNVSYLLGKNKPGYLTSYFNSIQVKIPAEACFEILYNHVFAVGFGPGLQIDILYQELLFDEPVVNATAAFSLFTNFSYEYWFGEKKRVGLGLNNIFDFTFYRDIFIDYKVQLYSIVRIPISDKVNTNKKKIFIRKKEAEKEDKKEEEKIKVEDELNKSFDDNLDEDKIDKEKMDENQDTEEIPEKKDGANE